MNVVIIGPGAVGTLLGALLAADGHSVSFRGREPRAAVRRIRVTLPGGWLRAESAKRAPADGAADLVLVTLARHHLHALKRPDFLRLVGSGECPVVLFNTGGLDTARLGLDPARERKALTLLTAVMLQEGDVELAPGRSVVVYERGSDLAVVFGGLARFGIQTAAVDDMEPLAHAQLLSQLVWLPAAMCNATLAGFCAVPEGRELAGSVLDEGFQAFEKAGMAVGTLPVQDPRDFATRLRRKAATFGPAAAVPDRAYSSVLQSFLRGRPTEAAQINRRVVDIGSGAGLHLTWNWRLLQKASRVSGLGFFRDPADLLAALQ